MDSQTFRAGTAPGSPDSYREIKALILYCLDKVSASASFELLHEAMRTHELVNYFALIEAVEQLSRSGHLECGTSSDGGAIYTITKLGRETALELHSALPRSVRDKAVSDFHIALKREARLKEVSISEEKLEKGFILELSIPDDDLLSVKVFAPSETEKNLIKRRFLNDPEYIYKGIMALLTGDRDAIGQMFADGEITFGSEELF